MSRRSRKPAVFFALALLSLPLLAAVTIVIVANTEAGTRWAIEKTASRLPGSLQAEEFDGTLWRGIRFPVLAYGDADWRIDATAIQISFDWSGLVAGRVTIRDMAADTITYTDLSAPPEQPEPLNVAAKLLPVTVTVDAARARRFVVAARGETAIENISIDDAWFDGRRIRAGSVVATTAAIEIATTHASLLLDGSIPVSAALRWRMTGYPWSGRGNVRGTVADIQFDQFVEGPYPGGVSGSVSLRPGSDPVVDALINWERWTIAGRTAEDGEARVRGWLDDYDLQYDTALLLTDDLRVKLAGNAHGNYDGLDRFNATLENAHGRAEASGNIQWNPALQLFADFLLLEADAELVSSLLTGSIKGNASLHYDESGILDIDSRLATEAGALQARGTISATVLSLDLNVDVPQLGRLADNVSGSVRASGTLSGTPDDPLLSLDLHGSDVRPGGEPAPELEVDASVTVRGRNDGLVSTIKRATIAAAATGPWSLRQPAEVQIRGGAMTATKHRWSGAGGELTVARFEIGQETAAIVAELHNLPLSLADSWLPPDIRLLGSADAGIELLRSDEQWSGKATWMQTDTVMRVERAGEEQADVAIPRVAADARLERGALFLGAEIAIEPGVTGKLELQLAELARDAGVSARLSFAGDDWAWVSALVPQVDRLEGAVSASVSAAGTLAAPDLAGTLEWHDGQLLVPFLNVPLREIDVVVAGDKRGTATLTASASAGDGTLAVDGRFTDLMSRSRSLQLRVQGKAAELLNWPEYHVWASPDVVVTADAGGWRVDGEIGMPKAEISVKKLPEEAVTISPDVRVLGEEETTKQPSRLGGETRLVLGERVHIDAMGLDSDLRGTLLLRKRPDREPTAEGQITLVNGSFTAYGRKLAIRHGELTFTGPLDDPIVDATAIRVIETIDGSVTAGIHLTGRAQNLTATVFSEPAMADADALSYLVVGRPLNQATEAESRDLGGAAVALGLRQANRLVDQIGQSIGLDQLSLTGDGGESTALVAGKQLNRRLYARYAYGVFSRLGSFLLRYRMTDKLTLEAATGEQQSIDVLYSVEKP